MTCSCLCYDHLFEYLNNIRSGKKAVEVINELKKHKIIIYYAATYPKTK